MPKETRGWDADGASPSRQRGKEEAADYRYFPDPDLVPVTVSEDWKRRHPRASSANSPPPNGERFETEHQLSHYDASVIVAQGQPFADYFEHVAAACGDAKQAANWVTQDVLREMKDRQLAIEAFPIAADVLGILLKKIASGKSRTTAAASSSTTLLEGARVRPATAADSSKSSRKNRSPSLPTRRTGAGDRRGSGGNAKIVADVQRRANNRRSAP